jgi:methionyl-tRNA formyltransferase
MHDKLMAAGADLLVKTVKGLADERLEETPQGRVDTVALKHAPKIFKENLSIDWCLNVAAIDRFVRGMSPYPTAFTSLGNKQMKIYSVHTKEEVHTIPPGTYQTDNTSYLRFAAGDGWVFVDELQMEGKKRMNVVDFLRGFRG